ncbi:hypothetical protein [uncultured Roseobacter sp.]|uniref:hypothetical protein n=1 Tax=uncultured Roseobacter sp. TaxID=114847 RepID=UPI002623FA22|nr:hypothetical protein [uncultured Roseobacter sp.]
MKRPNNFPREGMNEPVTVEAIKRLERERPVLNEALHYTFGGDVKASVHTNLAAEREAAIAAGARRLLQTSEQAKKEFGATKPDARTEYIRQQLNAARGSKPQKIRKYSPAR